MSAPPSGSQPVQATSVGEILLGFVVIFVVLYGAAYGVSLLVDSPKPIYTITATLLFGLISLAEPAAIFESVCFVALLFASAGTAWLGAAVALARAFSNLNKKK